MMKDCSAEEIMSALQAPFPSKDIEWRVSRSGANNNGKWAFVLAYVTNRAIQARLDDVFGPAGWKNSYQEFKEGIVCTISCMIEGHWIEKADGAEQTDIESLKGGLSNAMKRAAVQWGIGRYLYRLDGMFVEVFNDKREGAFRVNDKKNSVSGYWFPPTLPSWALPENEKSLAGTNRNSQKHTQQLNGNKQSGNGKSGAAPHQSNEERPFNRSSALGVIGEYLENTGLKSRPELILPLFKKINPDIKQRSLNEVYEKASEEELRKYYSALKPVNDLVNCTKHYGVAIEDSLRYVQILLPQITVKSLFSCFLNLNGEHVREISRFIKEDLKSGTIEKIA
ncbi:Rad52/Rad22 family DNA repair protein [Mesobacillus zeae]|uniref:Rad52/Rad22 family DNA repair protein n=1 Tax=Mesobacillus zeae TaxID=1917180 RepID=UPI00300A7E9F